MCVAVVGMVMGLTGGGGSGALLEARVPEEAELPQWEGEAFVPTVTVTVLFDNNPYEACCQAAWGFACLVEGLEKTVLFDTGGSPHVLLDNMAALGKEAPDIDIVILSHIHGDHIGGLGGIIAEQPEATVYLPAAFPRGLKEEIRSGAGELIEVREPAGIVDGACSTGEMGRWIKEQALIVTTRKGPVLITGCAHPGILNVVRKAGDITGQSLHLVLGGFHLSGASQKELERVVAGFQREQVRQVAPCHCSGAHTREMLRIAYEECYHPAGVGYVVVFD